MEEAITPYLSGISSGGGSDMASQLLQTGIGLATGAYKGRPQWRDVKFMDDVQNRLLPSQMKREQDYLAGMTPHQAAAYNLYQDQTYLRDTQRRGEGIMQLAEMLDMSPWELTGSGGSAAPMPAVAMQEGGAAKGSPSASYMAGIIPLQQAKIQSQTQLQIAAMQTKTQKDIAAMQTAGGELPRSQVDLNAANTAVAATEALLKGDIRGLTQAQTSATEQSTKESIARVQQIATQTGLTSIETKRTLLEMNLSVIEQLRKTMPQIEVKTPFGHITGNARTDELLRMLDENRLTAGAAQQFNMKEVDDALRATSEILRRAAEGTLNASDNADNILGGLWDSAGDFLTNKKWDDPEAYKFFKR